MPAPSARTTPPQDAQTEFPQVSASPATGPWRRLHQRFFARRIALKAAFFIAVVFFVLYPRFWLFAEWIQRWSNPAALVDPNHPEVIDLANQVSSVVSRERRVDEYIVAVERVVYQRIPYAHDWDTWGVMDYVPTTSEAFALGREDCDGRAVVAAAVFRRLGFDASIVTDLKHAWVVLPQGEAMDPGVGEKTISGSPDETVVRVGWSVVGNLARGLSYAVTVFPAVRALIILAALVAVLWHPWMSVRRGVIGTAVLVGAYVVLRSAGAEATALSTYPAATVAGGVLLVIGIATLMWRSRRARADVASPRAAAAS